MHFVGAAADAGVALVAVEAAEGKLVGLADASVDLEGVVEAAVSPLAGQQLDEGPQVAGVAVDVTSIVLGGCAVGHGAQGLDVDEHVDDHPLDGLAGGDGFAEALALPGPLDAHVEGALHLAEGGRAAGEAVVGDEPALTHTEAVALFAEDVGVGDYDVVEGHLAGGPLDGAVVPSLDLGDVDARGALVDEEHGDSATAPLILVGDGLQHPEVTG